MTTDVIESSEYLAAPIELYRFLHGPDVFTLTSSDLEYTYQGEVYVPTPLLRGSDSETGDTDKDEILVTLPGNHEIPMLYAGFPPGDLVSMTRYKTHRTDPDSEVRYSWSGFVIGCNWVNDGSHAELICEPIEVFLQHPGLTRPQGPNCPYAVYHKGCFVNRDLHRVSGTAGATTVYDVVVPEAAAYADGHFTGGAISILTLQGYSDSRLIVSHVGNLITMVAPMKYLQSGTPVSLYPGCDKTLSTCDAKFGNTLNFGGWPFRPNKNPFGGDPIY